MGCSNSSSLNASHAEMVPARIRPLLRPMEDLRKRRNEVTLSKKKLLKDAEEEDGDSQSSHETETMDKVSPKKTKPAEKEIVVRVITVEKQSRVVPLVDFDGLSEEEKDCNNFSPDQDNNDKEHDQEKVKHVDEKVDAEVQTEEGKAAETEPEPENKHEEEDAKNDDDEEEEEEEEEIGRLVYPRSPSFRIYYIEAEMKKEEERKNQTISMHQKSPSVDSVKSAASRNSGNSNKVVEIESTTRRKGNKIMKLRAVKHLLNVKSCYLPIRNCTDDNRGCIVVAKAAN